MTEVSLFVALLAGLLSFLSPCVLPIVPAYVGRIAALAGDEPPTLHAILFTAGFTALFALLGLGAAYAGGALGRLLPFVQVPLGLAMDRIGAYATLTVMYLAGSVFLWLVGGAFSGSVAASIAVQFPGSGSSCWWGATANCA